MALFFLTKMLGKKQVSQLSAFDYVIGISMGSIAAEMTINMDAPFFDGLTAMAAYAIVAFLVSYLTLKSIRLRRFFTGVPIILIQDGKIIKKNLRKALLDLNDLLEEARNEGYFEIGEIAYAIMETTGHISFLLKTENRPVTLKDLKLKDTVAGLSANVIIDGNIMENNLKIIKKEKKWLIKEIKKQGYENPESIFLATVDVNYKVVIYEYSENIEPKDVLE
ncbi:MAG: DUF421 domain-containing protein [Bacilli bacterium]|nr:DUF421 domain-containing protein [Bacilli bacterium]